MIRWDDSTSAIQGLHSYLPFDTNRYYHVVATFANRQAALYVNRRKLAAFSTDYPPMTNNEPLIIGDVRHTSYPIFRGYIDSLRIYNRALTTEEVDALYFVDE